MVMSLLVLLYLRASAFSLSLPVSRYSLTFTLDKLPPLAHIQEAQTSADRVNSDDIKFLGALNRSNNICIYFLCKFYMCKILYM